MRGHVRSVLIGVLFVAAVSTARAQVTFTPQVGVNASFLRGDIDQVTRSASAGYQIGVNVRFGDFLHLQQGLYWQRTESKLSYEEVQTSDFVSTDMIHVPILAGLKILPLETLGIRVNTGASLNFVTSVGQNTLGLTKDDFKPFLMGWVIGVGMDVLFLSADLSYELGLTTAVEVDLPDEVVRLKNDVLRFNVGIRF